MASFAQKSTDDQIKIAAFVLVTGGVVYFFADRYFRNKKSEDTQLAVLTDPNVNPAMTLRQAMNPSGFSWLFGADGTDKDAIWEVAPTIKDIKKVAEAYKNMYNSNLLADLQSDLTTTEYKKFLSMVGGGSSVISPPKGTKTAPTVTFKKYKLKAPSIGYFDTKKGRSIQILKAPSLLKPEVIFIVTPKMSTATNIVAARQLKTTNKEGKSYFTNWYHVKYFDRSTLIDGYVREDDLNATK